MWSISKPAEIFDRDVEWAELVRFASDDRPGATLGVVSGRRRQGKTLLLYELVRATGGFYFGATEATSAESLRRLGEALGQHTDAPGPLRLRRLVERGGRATRAGPAPPGHRGDRRVSVPGPSQSGPSVDHPARPHTRPGGAHRLPYPPAVVRLGPVVHGRPACRLGPAARTCRRWNCPCRRWTTGPPRPSGGSMILHSLPGCSPSSGARPAYRREYVQDDAPDGPDDFDDWVVRAVLNPARPLFREARYLLAEDPDLRDTALYHSVLSAAAGGNGTRGGIAGYIGRKATDLQHPLTVLEDAGLLIREPDPLRSGRSRYRITEPLIIFYQAVMRPAWTALEQRRGADVWRRSQRRFSSAVLGPASRKSSGSGPCASPRRRRSEVSSRRPAPPSSPTPPPAQASNLTWWRSASRRSGRPSASARHRGGQVGPYIWGRRP